MKSKLLLWIISIPLFFMFFLYPLFITNKIVYASQFDCKPLFIFTPQNVQYCSDIYFIDIIFIMLKEHPISYIGLFLGLYIIGFMFYLLLVIFKRFIKNLI
ncbi:hypothetical protein ABWK42_25340 [Bacillus sp. JJ927]|uniref:hypothetical protein n=1 Tax=Bacillus sp. JJ927 TaxID=3122976 RepID=UPI003395598C